MKRFYVLFLLLAPVPTFAYLDPGTGSLLLYAIVGVATSVAFALRNLWYRILDLFSAGRTKKYSADLPDIVFHSEGGRYWQVFEPVVAALDAKGIPCAYVTPDPKDPAFAFSRDHRALTAIHPGNEMMTIAFMNRVRTKVVVSTTPGLEVYMWKRSSRARTYVHLFHSPTTIEFYEKYSLSFYDVVLTVGEFQDRAIRELEALRGLPRKRLVPAGLTYFDYMLRECASIGRSTDRFTVLYAPSWGPRSSLTKYGDRIVGTLLGSGYRVIFRPHPQSAVSDKDILEPILRAHRDNPDFVADRNRTGIASMTDADVMITDLSGVLFDFAFLYSKPIILAAADAPVGGYEAEDLAGPLWDVEAARALSVPIPEDLDALPALVGEIARDPASKADRIAEFRKANVRFFGEAGSKTAEIIASIAGDEK